MHIERKSPTEIVRGSLRATPKTAAGDSQLATDLFAHWRRDVLEGAPPVLYPIGQGELERFEIGPGRVLLLGGPPGVGKSAFVMQAVVDALRLTPTLRALVANVEMTPTVMMDRQLARLSGIDLNTIRLRRLEERHRERIDNAFETLKPLSDRLSFARAPFTLANIAESADAVNASLIVFDYIQRISPPGTHGDKRVSVDATMDYLRQFADSGVAVIALAAVSRSKDSKGRSTYDGDALNLASFRESSELEFGADDAFILVKEPKSETGVILKHLKARHSEAKDIYMIFDRARQRFHAQRLLPPPGQRNPALEKMASRPASGESGGNG